MPIPAFTLSTLGDCVMHELPWDTPVSINLLHMEGDLYISVPESLRNTVLFLARLESGWCGLY